VAHSRAEAASKVDELQVQLGPRLHGEQSLQTKESTLDCLEHVLITWDVCRVDELQVQLGPCLCGKQSLQTKESTPGR
jgi:hypothetical protein